MNEDDNQPLLRRIGAALERLAPPAVPSFDVEAADAFVWHADGGWLEAVADVNRVPLELLLGIDRQHDLLIENTRRFAGGLPANNALLWGARGTGKSSLVKAVHARINDESDRALALIEIHREDTQSLPRLLNLLRGRARRFVLFCDDLSFDGGDASFKSLKAVLEGGDRGTPRQRDLLRHLEPPPSHAPRDDRERTLDRNQSCRIDGREGFALGPVRPVAGLSRLRSGDVSDHRRRLRPSLRARRRGRRIARPGGSNGR